MKIVSVVIAFAVLAGATALAVEGFGDRALFVPPPDAVAEGFTREVMSGRYDRARTYLAESEAVTNDELRAMRREGVTDVEAEIVSRTDTNAVVRVRLEGEEALRYELEFDREWKIASISERRLPTGRSAGSLPTGFAASQAADRPPSCRRSERI